MTTYKGYATFNDITDTRLRAWNRCATYYNLIQDRGQAEAKKYIDHFDDISKCHINSLIQEIKDKGYSTVRRGLVDAIQTH